MYQAFEIYQDKSRWANRLMNAYNSFEKYWNKDLVKNSPYFKGVLWPVPAYSSVQLHRDRITMGFMYMYLLGSMLMIGAVEWAALACFVALLVPHLLQSAFTHIGALKDNASYLEYGHYSLMTQQAVSDGMILVMMVMAGLVFFNKMNHQATAKL